MDDQPLRLLRLVQAGSGVVEVVELRVFLQGVVVVGLVGLVISWRKYFQEKNIYSFQT